MHVCACTVVARAARDLGSQCLSSIASRYLKWTSVGLRMVLSAASSSKAIAVSIYHCCARQDRRHGQRSRQLQRHHLPTRTRVANVVNPGVASQTVVGRGGTHSHSLPMSVCMDQRQGSGSPTVLSPAWRFQTPERSRHFSMSPGLFTTEEGYWYILLSEILTDLLSSRVPALVDFVPFAMNGEKHRTTTEYLWSRYPTPVRISKTLTGAALASGGYQPRFLQRCLSRLSATLFGQLCTVSPVH
jgi:hypothetical protein